MGGRPGHCREEDEAAKPSHSKELYVTFGDEAGATVARHLQKVLFIDRVLETERVDAVPEGRVRVTAHPGGDELRKQSHALVLGGE